MSYILCPHCGNYRSDDIPTPTHHCAHCGEVVHYCQECKNVFVNWNAYEHHGEINHGWDNNDDEENDY